MARKLPLIYYPDPLLRQQARPVSTAQLPSSELRQLILDMEKTMVENDGIGLAAPQVGVSQQLCIINTQDGVLVLINPTIKKKSWKKESGEEGCLSIPKVFGDVKRHKKITVSTLTPEGKRISFDAEGLFARVIQHEIDHLNGVLFIDRTNKINQGKELLKTMEQKYGK